MSQNCEHRLDAATGLSLGRRKNQEDAILSDVPRGGGAGILVLADGLGGHVSGAVASRLAVTTALEELTAQRDSAGRLGDEIPALLMTAAQAANHAILTHAETYPATKGMGATLLIAIVEAGRLHWLSIGDSPFYLLRDGEIRQLNEIHSLAPQFDFLAQMGEMDPQEAANHPDRSCLTSALGCEPMRQIDCPGTPFDLEAGDMLVLASDGILTLPEESIRVTCLADPLAPAADLVEGLLGQVAAADAEEQDNLSVGVMRILPSLELAAEARRGGRRGMLAWFGNPGATGGLPVGQALRGIFQPVNDLNRRVARSK